jgi:putative thiamine transport system permease protein
LVGAGQYRLLLAFGLTGGIGGVFLVHLAPVLAYVAVVLIKPYRSLDQRYLSVAASLSASPYRRWREIKLPLLKAPLLIAAAVGFSVSMVQFVPAQLAAAGRFETLPIAAVTLASGGNRALSAAFALALALPPLLAFLFAAVAGRPRWRSF